MHTISYMNQMEVCMVQDMRSFCNQRTNDNHVKPWSHYSDNQSPTSDNHFFGWLLEVVRGRQMFVDDRRPVGYWLSENYIDTSPLADLRQPLFFLGGFRRFLVVSK